MQETEDVVHVHRQHLISRRIGPYKLDSNIRQIPTQAAAMPSRQQEDMTNQARFIGHIVAATANGLGVERRRR
jgi:hypothetical protein